MERWTGRVALITGASSGIGEAIARQFSNIGVNVAALARRTDKLQALEKECKNNAGTLKTYRCDISDEKQIEKTLKQVYADFGSISILVNNAAIAQAISLTDTSISSRKLYETNLIGLVTMTQHVLKQMKDNNIDDGHIINVNTIGGHCVLPILHMANYCASKNALTVLSKSLKHELAAMKSNIRITNFSPGLVPTELAQPIIDRSSIELPALSCDDIVDAIIYVLSTKPHVNISELTIEPVGEDVNVIGK
ncbi:hypothetical protein O3M35_007104 [Rhynocoris fuscipes]|uniref:Dehydrogenase/reductase SDR family member 11 n=1 Tax=Rhynocoris fuscipes TaxID=488301 RepID=A0AAW1D8U8_9HEMI